MVPLEAVAAINCTGGEVEVENIPLQEVEKKRKDLLPVFEQFQRAQMFWGDRYICLSIVYFIFYQVLIFCSSLFSKQDFIL